MTPIADGNVITRGDGLYQEAQIKTKNGHRVFGLWKWRFPMFSCSISIILHKVPGIIVVTAT